MHKCACFQKLTKVIGNGKRFLERSGKTFPSKGEFWFRVGRGLLRSDAGGRPASTMKLCGLAVPTAHITLVIDDGIAIASGGEVALLCHSEDK